MKKYVSIFLLIAATFLTVHKSLADDDRTSLGWIDRSSVTTVLEQFGYSGYTVVSGYKTSQDDPTDGPGWYITARCQKDDQDYNATLWVSDDWKKGRVI
jgi:hypothetical protein